MCSEKGGEKKKKETPPLSFREEKMQVFRENPNREADRSRGREQ